jgi:3-dehydroquinate synthase
MSDLRVALQPPYWVRFRATFRAAWQALADDHGDRAWMIVVDDRLLGRHPHVLDGLSRARRRRVVALRAGESCKNLRTLQRLTRAALELGLDRRGLVVAVGGGTLGDVSGYFAASYQRGIDWCPLATTVVALADSAMGGKTAVNFDGLKNVLGAFHQPVGVYGALEALATLPRRHRVAGLAEIVKSGMIGDRRLFELLERQAQDLEDAASPGWQEAVARSAAIKADIVAADPREEGPRALLNFGHTFGHGLEAAMRPRLLHGEAVALGMIAATRISEWRAMAPEGTSERLRALLVDLGLPEKVHEIDFVSLFKSMRYDKKGVAGQARMVLTTGIGSATFGHAVPGPTLRRAARSLQARRTH